MDAHTKKRPRNELSLRTKIALINDSYGKSHRQLAELYNVGRSQVGSILKNKEKLIEAFQRNDTSKDRKRPRVNTTYDKVDVATWGWYLHMRSLMVPVTGCMVQEQAKRFALELGQTNFKASNGWLQRFKIRHGIDCFGRASVGASVTENNDDTKCSIPLVELMKHAVSNMQIDEPLTNGDEEMDASLPTSNLPPDDGCEEQPVTDLCDEDVRSCDSREDKDIKPIVHPPVVKSVADAMKMAEDLKVFASVRGLDTVYHYAAQIENELAKCL